MEYIIPRKLSGLNINFSWVYLELLNVLSCKNNRKNIKYSLRNQIFQEHINSITTGIILTKQLQIQFIKFIPQTGSFLRFLLNFTKRAYIFMIFMIRKFDACFDPPNLCRSVSEYFIKERLFWVSKTSPGHLYTRFHK